MGSALLNLNPKKKMAILLQILFKPVNYDLE